MQWVGAVVDCRRLTSVLQLESNTEGGCGLHYPHPLLANGITVLLLTRIFLGFTTGWVEKCTLAAVRFLVVPQWVGVAREVPGPHRVATPTADRPGWDVHAATWPASQAPSSTTRTHRTYGGTAGGNAATTTASPVRHAAREYSYEYQRQGEGER